MTESKKMTEELSESEKLREIRKYLSGYSVFRRLYENGFDLEFHFGNPISNGDPTQNLMSARDISAEARVQMFEIRRLITSLPSGDEKVFLFLRYIHGETLESCAERLGMTERNVFRLQKKALMMAYRHYARRKNDGKTKCLE